MEAEAERKAEKHQLAQEIGKAKKQILEIRGARAFMTELNKIRPQNPMREQEFQLTEAKSAA